MGRPLEDQVIETITFTASTKKGVDLPRDRVITEIDILFEAVFDTGSAVTDAQDAFYKMLGGLSIEGSGGVAWVDILDTRLLHYLNQQDWPGYGKVHFDDGTSQSDVTAYVPLRLHFGNNPRNPFDLSAGIRAEDIQELKFYVNWPAADRGGTGVTTDVTAAVRLLVKGVQGLSMAERARVAVPKITQSDHTIAATASALGKKFDLPVGAHLRRSLLMLLDNTAAPNDVRDDTRITNFALEVPKDQNRRPLSATWYQGKHRRLGRGGGLLVQDDGSTYDDPTIALPADIGIVPLDYREFTALSGVMDPWGLNMVYAQEGDIRLAFTIATANGTLKRLDEQIES